MTVTSTVGTKTQHALPFANLAQLLSPFTEHLAALPPAQAGALGRALGLDRARLIDRFTVGAATLSLLAAAAERSPGARGRGRRATGRPVVGRSAPVRSPAARGRGSGAARRPPRGRAEHPRRPRAAHVVPRRARPARRVGSRSASGWRPRWATNWWTPPRATRSRCSRSSRCSATTSGTGARRSTRRCPRAPASNGRFSPRVEGLPAEVRRLLVVASADWEAEPGVVQRAAQAIGIDENALAAAIECGAFHVDNGRLEFSHTLLRSAVYHTAEPGLRREAHQSLAGALRRDHDLDRRAWHLAAAAAGPDEQAASALERAGNLGPPSRGLRGGGRGDGPRRRAVAREREPGPPAHHRRRRVLARRAVRPLPHGARRGAGLDRRPHRARRRATAAVGPPHLHPGASSRCASS